MNNLTGCTFGHLTVLKPVPERHKSGEIIWLCSCECGRKKTYRASKIKSRVSCGICKESERKPRTKEYKKAAKEKQGKVHFSSLPWPKQLDLISEFIFRGDYKELSDEHGVTQDTLRNGIKLFRERLNTQYELTYMANAEKTALSTEVIEKALETNFVSKVLRDMLSADEEETLSTHELMYCVLYVNTGSNQIALKESQLDKCLTEPTDIRKQYLGMHLRNKPNIKKYIQLLQEEQLEELSVSKNQLQADYAILIRQLKERVALEGKSTDIQNMLTAMRDLGKTMGAFVEKVQVTEISAADALDTLLDMAEANVRELPPGEAQGAITYEPSTGDSGG
jgi:hypothetical protein